MKNVRAVITTALFVGGFNSIAHAQLGAPRYKIQSRAELRTQLLKNARNPRAHYDLTIWAHRRGWLGTVLTTGDEMLKKNRNDPYAQALLSFGVYTGLYTHFWNWPIDQTAGDVWGRQALAGMLQSQSLKVSNPAIQLMRAISLANMPTNAHGEFKEALGLFRQVLKSEPNWADAHYWYARALDRNSVVEGTAQRKKTSPQVLAQFERAEQLDKSLHNFLLLEKFITLSELDRPREALTAFDGYLRVYPAFKQHMDERDPGYIERTRTRLNKRIQQKAA